MSFKKLTISEIKAEIQKLESKTVLTNRENKELKLLKYFELKEAKQININ